MEDNKKTIKKIPTQRTRAKVEVSTFNETNRTIELTFATETVVRAYDWDFGTFNEVLSLAPEHVDLTRLKSGAPVLDNHNTWGKTKEVVVGVVEDAWLDGLVGRARVRFSNSEDDQELMEKVKDGIVTGVSVGYDVFAYEVTRFENDIPTCRAISWMPTEISFVPVQADINSRTRSADAEAQHDVTLNDITPIVASPAVVDPIVPVVEEKEITNIENKENNNNENTNEMTEEEKTASDNLIRSAAAKAEREKISGIRKHVRALGLPDAFADTLIEDETVTDLAVAGQRALTEWEKGQPLNPRQNVEQVNTEKEKTRSAMIDAFVLRIDPRASSVMGEDQKRAAQEFKGMTFLDFAKEALQIEGNKTRGFTPKQIAQAALGAKVRGMMHTTDFPLLLGDTIQRTLLAQYAVQARTFPSWAKRNTLSDFRTMTRVRVTEVMGDLELVREGQEYKYDAMGEGGESYKLSKYGKIIAITWEAIINDDLSAFNQIPQAFAGKAAQKQGDIVYDILVKNPLMSDGKALFHADHKNFVGTAGSLTTGGTALSETSLSTAFKTFRNQKGPDGAFLNISPKYLIVGPELEFLAYKLTSTNFTPNKQSDIAVGAITGLTPIIDPRIEGFTWFLAAEPTLVDTVEYAFLDGEEELFIEQREGFNIDGVEVKARMVFAAKAIDFRGLYRNNGAAQA